MRRITLFMITFGLLGAFQPDAAKAQFLKSLTDNLKQTLQNRANGTHSVSGATAGSGTGGNTKDTSLMWLTNSGEGRSEMCIPVPGIQTPKMIVIGHMTQPKYSIILDDPIKTYTLNVIDTALINSGSGDYQVTRVGTETVSGYSCVHSHLANTIGSGAFKTTSIYDIWTSTAVPGYALFSKMLTLAGSQGGIFGALAKADASGFLVLKLRLY